MDAPIVCFREDSSDDARNVGYRPGSAAALEAWVQTRLENYGQRDGLPADDEVSRSVVTATHILQTDGNWFQGSWFKLLINAVVSMGRRNTQLEPTLH